MTLLPRLAAPLLLLVAVNGAPFQCASKIEPGKRFEDEPGEALYSLAEKFKLDGNAGARAATLKFIVDRYPTSRFAEMARQDLAVAK